MPVTPGGRGSSDQRGGPIAELYYIMTCICHGMSAKPKVAKTKNALKQETRSLSDLKPQVLARWFAVTVDVPRVQTDR